MSETGYEPWRVTWSRLVRGQRRLTDRSRRIRRFMAPRHTANLVRDLRLGQSKNDVLRLKLRS